MEFKIGDKVDYLCHPTICLALTITEIGDETITCYCEANKSTTVIKKDSPLLHNFGTYTESKSNTGEAYIESLPYPKDLIEIEGYGYDIIPFIESLKGFDCTDFKASDVIKMIKGPKDGEYNFSVLELIYKNFIEKYDILTLVSQVGRYERCYRKAIIKQLDLPFVTFYSNIKVKVKEFTNCVCALMRNGKKICFADYKDDTYFFPYIPYIPSGYQILVSKNVKLFKKRRYIRDFEIECEINRTDIDTALNIIRLFNTLVVKTKRSIMIINDDGVVQK